jgi:hypothetical protein
LPLIVWSWLTMDTTAALLFTLYMVPVNLLDNVLRPFVFGRGLDVPVLVILIGVIGGTISQGITGLFLGPIVLAVIWNLLIAWIKEQEVADSIEEKDPLSRLFVIPSSRPRRVQLLSELSEVGRPPCQTCAAMRLVLWHASVY